MIEVLFALSLLTIAVLAILGMFPTMAAANRNTMELSTHLYSAQEKLDSLMLQNAFINNSWTQDTPFGSLDGYRQWRGVQDIHGQPTRYQEIQVEIQWVSKGAGKGYVHVIDLYGAVCPS